MAWTTSILAHKASQKVATLLLDLPLTGYSNTTNLKILSCLTAATWLTTRGRVGRLTRRSGYTILLQQNWWRHHGVTVSNSVVQASM